MARYGDLAPTTNKYNEFKAKWKLYNDFGDYKTLTAILQKLPAKFDTKVIRQKIQYAAHIPAEKKRYVTIVLQEFCQHLLQAVPKTSLVCCTT